MPDVFPVITASLAILFLAMLAVHFSRRDGQCFPVALAASLVVFALSVYALAVYDFGTEAIQMEMVAGFGPFSYSAGLDSHNILFFPLATIMVPLVLIYLQGSGMADDRRLLTAVLAYELVLLGMLTSLSLLQFGCWMLLEYLPLRVLAGSMASPEAGRTDRLPAYWRLMLILLFASILFQDAGNPAFVLLFFALAIRLPVFPFHGWLPTLVSQGNALPAFCLLASVKTGLYGMYRFLLPLVASVDPVWIGFAELLALFSIFYGALLALMQINIMRLLAFAVVSHNGMLVIGLFTGNDYSHTGTLLLSIAFGLASAGMILGAGFVRLHTGTTYIPRMGNLIEHKTLAALLFLLAALSTMAMPGTPGYHAAHMLLEGVIEENGWGVAIAILIGNVLAAAFLLRAFQQVFIAAGRQGRDKPQVVQGDTRHVEVLISTVICLLLILTGFYPLAELLGPGA